MLFISTGLVGAFMSSTATVAVFLPIAMTMANKTDLNPRRLLLPLAAASVIRCMMTLVATTPNIVINNMLKDKGSEPLAFFIFTPYGVVVLLLGAAGLTDILLTMIRRQRYERTHHLHYEFRPRTT